MKRILGIEFDLNFLIHIRLDSITKNLELKDSGNEERKNRIEIEELISLQIDETIVSYIILLFQII